MPVSTSNNGNGAVKTKRPRAGERTSGQSVRNHGRGRSALIPQFGSEDLNPPSPSSVAKRLYDATALTMNTGLPGYREPSPGDFQTYRLMDANPTLALAKGVLCGPIEASEWSVESDKGVAEERVEFIRDILIPMRTPLLQECLRGLSSGFRPFEKVYALEEGKFVLKKLKPLLPDITKILVDENTGAFKGVEQPGKNEKVILPPEKCFVYTHDGEAGDFYGRSRHENARVIWSMWRDANATAGKLGTKVASVIPILKYPRGSSRTNDQDEITATTEENRRIAQAILDTLGIAKGVAFETENIDEADLRANPELAKLAKWAIETVDTGSAATGMAGLVAERSYFDSLLFRSWLVPERTALEGKHGTLAESETQGDFALTQSELIHSDIVRHVNWYVVDDLLALNFGEDARGTVWLKAAPIVDKRRVAIGKLYDAMLANPATLEVIVSETDRGNMYELLGLPAEADENAEIDLMPQPDVVDEDGEPVPPGAANKIGGMFKKARGGDDEDADALSMAMSYARAYGDGLALNCGTGAGGFKPGNTCAQGEGISVPTRKGALFGDGPAGRPQGAGKKIELPKDDADVQRWLAEVEATPEYMEAGRRIDAYADDTQSGSPTKWSEEKFSTNGVYEPERAALHEKIVRNMLAKGDVAPEGSKPVAVLLIGLPGSGKTTAGGPYTKAFGVGFVPVNADDIKEELPEYEGWNAALVHEESGYVAENLLTNRAAADRRHMMFDATGKNTGKMTTIANLLAERGYQVHVVNVNLPPYKAVARAWSRFQKNAFNWTGGTEPGRFVPPRYAYSDVDGGPMRSYNALKDNPNVDSWVNVSNDVPEGATPIVLDQGSRRAYKLPRAPKAKRGRFGRAMRRAADAAGGIGSELYDSFGSLSAGGKEGAQSQ